jgi:alpha-amylase
MSSGSSSKMLRNAPREKAFYFFTSVGNYTGMSAASLKEFMERVNDVNIKSLEFHLQRGDFEKWVEEVLQDKDLAWDIKRLQRFNLTGNALRNQLSMVVSRRYKRLEGPRNTIHS